MPECRDTVTGFFQDDHRRLDDVYERFQQARKAGAEEALAPLQELTDGLRRHIAWEEEHLFPLFEQRTGMSLAGPTAAMRREHRHIEQLLDALHDALGAGRSQELERQEAVFADILAQHNAKEEQVLYPSIDNLLSEDACADLFRRIRGG